MNNKKYGKILTACLLSAAISAGMLLPGFPVKAESAMVETIGAPEKWEYLWNGTHVDDRKNFTLSAADWQLATTYAQSAVITTKSSGAASYSRTMGDWWTASVDVSFSDAAAPAEAAWGFVGERGTLSIRLNRAENGATSVALLDGETVIADCGTAAPDNRTFTLIADNTHGGDSLRLHLSGDGDYERHLSISELSDDAKAVLADTSGIRFSSDTSGIEFFEIRVNDLKNPFEGNPEEALAFLESETARVLSLNQAMTHDGRTVSTPDTSQNYNAAWLRDFMFMALNAPDHISLQLMIDNLEFNLERVRADGWIPDRVEFNGTPVYSAGDAPGLTLEHLDTVEVAAFMLDCVLKKMDRDEDREAFFNKWEATIMHALDILPKDENGLVYNDPDPAKKNITFGHIDCVIPTGSLMSTSAYTWKAYTIMADWQETFGKDSSTARTAASKIEAALEPTFYNEAYGLFNEATLDCNQPSIMSSCFAVSIGFPLSDKARTSIAKYLYDHYDEVCQFGYFRHLPAGEYWEGTWAAPEEYMNGAYWAPMAGWYLDSLKEYAPELARRSVERLIAYGAKYGFYECINGSNRKLQDYVNAITNVLPVARELLTTPAESVTVSGPDALKAGMTGTYTAAVAPDAATVRSVSWRVNGAFAGEGNTLSYRFEQAGVYTLTATAIDTNSGSVSSSEFTVTVSDYDPGAVILTMPEISGKAGDVVSVPVSVGSASQLTGIDLQFHFDPAVLEPVSGKAPQSLYAMPGDAWSGGLIASNLKEADSLLVSISRAAGLESRGTLFTLQFKLLQTVDAANAVRLRVEASDCRVATEEPGIAKTASILVDFTAAGNNPSEDHQPSTGSSSASCSGNNGPVTGVPFDRLPICLGAAAAVLLAIFKRKTAKNND